ncbi:aromatic ring-hydroxylating dioxygenase subunit alpha [Novosphingobium sp.]|uniref:aromatic ring-hydroxylating oxygenase subunit alpha n=1 Tax=Novosphingobium sp. TaxID=1874826 RepID=UPI0025F4404E|nr:aromatic ring-hydroxylating dioxygenase subunit alpha [Novosphingobium sp.]
MDITARRPGPSVQEVFAGDINPAPDVLRAESPAQGQSSADVSAERYFSKDWHDREVEKVWRKCWQLAARVEHIPNVGDHVVYDIVHDSLIVIRTAPDEVRAYVNSCLHRGTMLRTEGGCVNQLRCPFHGWTWKLDGTLSIIPGQWDFPHVNKDAMRLPEAKVGIWGGFVFVNFDPDCEPLESYLENLPEHFASFNLEDRYVAAHVAKIMPCNWKLAMEAFVEAYHVSIAHPQVMGYYGDTNTQYDVWPEVRHVSRMISVQGVPSPSLKGIPAERTIEEMRRDVPFFAGRPIVVGEGETARGKLAERAREKISRSIGRDMSALSDSESLDLIEYTLFPNMVPWGGQALPITYRFRPNGDDPESSIMEIMFLFSKAPDGSHPAPAKMTMLGPDQNWSDAPELGSAAMVADQDTDNLMRIQKGLRASRKPGVTLARYQESRIRHFHETLDAYLSA